MADDRDPRIFLGSAAGLRPFQPPTETSHDETTEEQSEEMILARMPVLSAVHQIDDEMQFQNVAGFACVAADRFLFVAADDREEHDIAVDAECIQLHAEGESEASIYLQFQQSEHDTSMELTLQLRTPQDSQSFFEALTRLISLHPVLNDEDDDDNRMMGGDAEGAFDGFITAENLDTFDRIGTGSGENAGSAMGMATEATDQERDAMLERLDDLLVVPPHMEIPDDNDSDKGGQFDDAD